MRFVALAACLTLVSAIPASATPLGSPAPASPMDVDRFNGPNLGEPFPGVHFTSVRAPMQRLGQVCGSSSLRDRRTCTRAWNEINAGYAQLQAARQAGSTTPN